MLRPARLHLIGIQSVSLCQALNKAIGSAGCTVLHNLFGVGGGGGGVGSFLAVTAMGGTNVNNGSVACIAAVQFGFLS